jgi:hypothetical protein
MRNTISLETTLFAVMLFLGGASIASPAFAAMGCLNPALPQHTLAETTTTDSQTAYDKIAKLGNRCTKPGQAPTATVPSSTTQSSQSSQSTQSSSGSPSPPTSGRGGY